MRHDIALVGINRGIASCHFLQQASFRKFASCSNKVDQSIHHIKKKLYKKCKIIIMIFSKNIFAILSMVASMSTAVATTLRVRINKSTLVGV